MRCVLTTPFITRVLVSSVILLGLAHSAWGTNSGWDHTRGGPLTDSAASVAIHSSENVYMAGSTDSFGAGGYDLLILKYSHAGNLLWSRTWGGKNNEYASRIAVGPDISTSRV